MFSSPNLQFAFAAILGLVVTATAQAQRDAREPAPTPTLDKLISDLGSGNVLEKLRAAKELGNLGAKAKDAVPALQKALQDPDDDVRKVASNALQNIQRGEPAVGNPGKSAGGVNEDTLAGVLKDLGHDAKSSKIGNQTIYTMTIPRDGWTYVIEVSISPNQKFVWLVGPLDKVGADQKNRAAPLRSLLEENWSIAPFFFSMNKAYERIYLQRALENRNFEASTLAAEIEGMMAILRRTQSLWQASRWNDAALPGNDVPRPTN